MSLNNNQNPTILSVNIIHKSSCNQRFSIDLRQVDQMVATLENGKHLPPIYVRSENGQYGCYDGNHRLESYRKYYDRHNTSDNEREIQCIIQELNDIDATSYSYLTNCGKGWTIREEAATCLNLYKKGESVSDIKTHLSKNNSNTWNDDLIRSYIKIAEFLHPDILSHVKSGGKHGVKGSIPLDAAKYLCGTETQIQIIIYNEIQNLQGSKIEAIKFWFKTNKIIPVTRSITSINKLINLEFNHNNQPQSFLPSIQVLEHDQQYRSERAIFINTINHMIQDYCNRSNISRVSIIDNLERDEDINLSE